MVQNRGNLHEMSQERKEYEEWEVKVTNGVPEKVKFIQKTTMAEAYAITHNQGMTSLDFPIKLKRKLQHADFFCIIVTLLPNS